MLLGVTLAVALLAAQSDQGCLGMTSQPTGFQWRYAGTIVHDVDNHAQTERVTWTSTVIETRSAGGVHLVLVEGFVTDLAFADVSGPKRRSILMCSEGRLLVRLLPEGDVLTRSLADWDPAMLGRGEVLLEPLLREGQVFGQDPPRDDGMYGWVVGTTALRSDVPASCPRSPGQAYRLTQRFLTDHSVVEWWPGVGITSFEFKHHGTPGEADVRLVGCRPPER